MATWQWQRMPCLWPVYHYSFSLWALCYTLPPILTHYATANNIPLLLAMGHKKWYVCICHNMPSIYKTLDIVFCQCNVNNVFAKLWLFRFIYTSCAVVKRNLVSKCRILVLSRHSLWIRVYYDSQTGKKKNCSVRNAQISWWSVLTGIMLVNFVVKSCTGCDSESLRLPHVGSESHTELSFFWKE